MKASDFTSIIILGIAGLALWQVTKAKGVPTPTGDTKMPTTEYPNIPFELWQSLTAAQMKLIAVTGNKGWVGNEEYYKVSQPLPIGDTGFKIWGVSDSGAAVVSMKDPSTYDPWDWF